MKKHVGKAIAIICFILALLSLTMLVILAEANPQVEDGIITLYASRHLGVSGDVELQETSATRRGIYTYHEYIMEAGGVRYFVGAKKIGPKVLEVYV